MNEGFRILVVDDDEVDRMSVLRALRAADLDGDVVEAARADDALAELLARPFDCALVDFRLPGRDGLWLLREARRLGSTVPVIVLTGQGDGETAAELMKSGAADYIPKGSLTAERLELSIRNAVHLSRVERQIVESRETQRHHADELRDREERLRMALSAADLGTWELSLDSALVRMDERTRALFGDGGASEVPFEGFLAAVHPEDLPLVRTLRELREAPAGNERSMELRLRSGELGERWVRIAGKVFVFERRGERCFVGTVQDVTQRKREELEVRRRAEFEQQLIGIVSHDLRNPLGAILLADQLLKREGLTERQEKLVGRIDGAAQRALGLIRDLLDFTQARLGGGIALHRRTVELMPFVYDVVEELKLAQPSRKIEVEASPGCVGHWDPDRLRQVLENLLTNALKYSPPDTPVSLKVRSQGATMLLEVHNLGPPIPPDRLPLVFQPLQRAVSGAENPGRSIGLGLYIVEHLVRAHAGSVWVRSTPEHGTTFSVRLPQLERTEQRALA